MRAVFFSDAHLRGADDEGCGLLLSFLRDASQNLDHLFIVGDLFDFWFSKGGVVYPGFQPIIDELAAMQFGRPASSRRSGRRPHIAGVPDAFAARGRARPAVRKRSRHDCESRTPAGDRRTATRAVVPSLELSPSWAHFNAWPLRVGEALHIDTSTANVDEIFAEARRLGAIVVQANHPFNPYGSLTRVSRAGSRQAPSIPASSCSR